jgi:hypothetical protein
MNKFIILSFILSIAQFGFSQSAIGTWQEYLSYSNVHSVEKIDDIIYAASDIGIFTYDTEEYIMQKFTKLNSLSDIDITTMAAIPNSSKLFIGYSNGNIDIFEDGEVENIPDLEMKTLSYSKQINHIDFFNDFAYCSTDFGILVVDYNNLEIKDFYYIGDEASDVVINQIAHTTDSIFVATESGLRKASINSTALAFYETWKYVGEDKSNYAGVIEVNNHIIIAKENSSSHDIYSYEDGQWSSITSSDDFSALKAFTDNFAVISNDQTDLYYNNLILDQSITSYDIENTSLTPDMKTALVDDDDNIWIGDQDNGLIQIAYDGDTQLLPDGPYSNTCFKLLATGSSLWSVAGDFEHTSPTDAILSIYRDNEWKYITSYNESKISDIDNFCDIVVDPDDDTHAYIASCNDGIVEIQNDTVAYTYNDTNSGLQEIYIWELVGGIVMDEDGNLFANNQEVSYPIVVKPVGITDDADGWYQYDYMPYDDAGEQCWLREMIYTSWGDIWAISGYDPHGLFVFDINGTIDDASDDSYRSPENPRGTELDDSRNTSFSMWDEDGVEISSNPQCIVEDKDGYIWVGTNQGLYVYYQPQYVFDVDEPTASQILVPRNDGSGLADYLLEDASINAIAVDGANRKWIGTDTEGAYLVSSDGTYTVETFNTDNSSLISDQIISISIDPETGEVFFGTDMGIVSYMGTAIEGKESYSDAYAYPNPVKPNYEGVITVTGLMEDSNVKITDISGKLVYEANSTGGQIVWSGKNFDNKKVSSGVYLVFATNEDGSVSMVTKIMIIR